MKRCLLDLFCGAGGLSSGLEMAGLEVSAGIDIDCCSIQTFKFNFPNALSLTKDLGEYHPRDFSKDYGFLEEDFDVIIGGPPCQGFSISGPRNFDDPRNKLYLEFIKYVEFFKPKAFLAENVPGLVGLYGGKAKKRIIEAFESIGYHASYRVLLASDYGVPQDRKRVFFVGTKSERKFRFPDPTHFDTDRAFGSLVGKRLRKVRVAEAIDDLPLLENELGNEAMGYAHPPSNDYQRYCREGSTKVYNHIAAKHIERTKKIIALVPEGGNYKLLPPELQNTRRFHIAWTRINSQKPAPTVDTGHRHHFHPWVNRVPTVRENARFQSFQDRFVFQGPKTSQYEQVGNAVPPLLAKAIGQEMTKLI
jgi:DNA (cytosine-5)-methyltransferase 1